MKLAIIGDIHANLLALNLALEDAKKKNVDKYIFLGDYITDGDHSNDILDLIKQYADYAILGNREKYILNYNIERKAYNNYKTISYTYDSLSKKSINYIKTLKNNILIEIQNTKLLIIHGDTYWTNENEMPNFYDRIIEDYDDFDICLFGHSHIYSDIFYKGKRFINPGSIGEPTDYPTYKYCILDINSSVNIQLREFNTAESYKELERLYKNTKYYKENPIWSNLILDTIRYGRDCCCEFIDLLNSKLDHKNSLSSKEFNKIWEETYIEYSSVFKQFRNTE